MNMQKSNWKIAKKISAKARKSLSEIEPIILQLLLNRGVFSNKDSKNKAFEKINSFLDPDYNNLHDPFLFRDMKKAVLRIQKAIDKNEKIAIFGDYDADGVTASAVLFESLKYLGAKPIVYIPHRDKEGYGLNKEAIKKLYGDKISLIITVDCGIINISEVAQAKKMGVDVIVTDHHEPSKNLPKALAVIDPKVKTDKYPFRDLAGVGVSFKLAQALIIKSKKGIEGMSFLKWLLDLVAIGSIGDIVSLVDENRILVKFGSIVFKKTRRLGLKELKKSSSDNSIKIIDFHIAPRLNSAGRMDHANWAFNLLVTESKVESFQLIRRIERLNNERRDITEKIIKEAKEEIEPVLPEETIIIIARKDWSASVSGIVASRLVDEYNIPALVVEKKGKMSKGSARSPKNINIIKMLRRMGNLFTKLGGHKNAAGFSYETRNHQKIIEALQRLSRKDKREKNLECLDIDMELGLKEVSLNLYKRIEDLEPFGHGNPRPVFLTKKVRLLDKKLVGNNNHLKIWFTKDNLRREAIAFRKGYLNEMLKVGQDLDVVYRLGENEYGGMRSIQLEVVDIK